MKYKTELHCHTKESSSCSKIDAKQLVEWYFKEAYSTIVVTDHCSKRKMERLGNIPWKEKVEYITRGYYIAKKIGNMLGISVLLGVEITLEITDSDYLIYGIKEDFLKKHEKIYTYSLEKLYEICKENGLLLVQAHPFRDGIEVAPL